MHHSQNGRLCQQQLSFLQFKRYHSSEFHFGSSLSVSGTSYVCLAEPCLGLHPLALAAREPRWMVQRLKLVKTQEMMLSVKTFIHTQTPTFLLLGCYSVFIPHVYFVHNFKNKKSDNNLISVSHSLLLPLNL